ncbi:hypothetical protein [Kitasatospora sp. NBC_00315]|uniref:hypothetical protein n=1 Tax=Kitasatospora sp. NBC_00315 TaxID=2975963 RepID=UPI00324E1698
MALRKDTEAAPRPGEQLARQGRHSRPKPFGGRLRLPTLRFSGAAMAMSTVVGISIATTWLLNEQQSVGRRTGFASVGASPPPSPAAERQPDTRIDSHGGAPGDARGSAAPFRAAGPADSAPGSRGSGRTPPPAAAAPTASPAAVPPTPAGPGQGVTGTRPTTPCEPAAGPSAAPGPVVPSPVVPTPLPAADAPPPSLVPASLASAAAGKPSVAPTPAAQPPAAGITPVPQPLATHLPVAERPADAAALSGTATHQSLGRDGARHVLGLTVTEPLTALEAEFRLNPSEVAPGATAWTDLAGAVMTASSEDGVLVYRFTSPAGTDVRPGDYTFGVRRVPSGGTGRAVTGDTVAAVGDDDRAGARTPTESWTASAFGILTPRAVAALGDFGRTPAAPVPAPAAVPARGR